MSINFKNLIPSKATIALLGLMSPSLVGCFSSDSDSANQGINYKQEVTNELKKQLESDSTVNNNDPYDPDISVQKNNLDIQINQVDFNQIATFVELKGFVVKEDGISCDHQFNFIDSDGNEHRFLSIRRLPNFTPSTNAPVVQISDYCYKGKKSDHNFIGSIIYPNRIESMMSTKVFSQDEENIVRQGYQELLKKSDKFINENQ